MPANRIMPFSLNNEHILLSKSDFPRKHACSNEFTTYIVVVCVEQISRDFAVELCKNWTSSSKNVVKIPSQNHQVNVSLVFS
jgi:hypothetical protein